MAKKPAEGSPAEEKTESKSFEQIEDSTGSSARAGVSSTGGDHTCKNCGAMKTAGHKCS